VTISGAAASASEVLGRFVAASRWEDLDAGTRHEAKRALLNSIGSALAAAPDPAVATAIAVMQPFSGPGRLTVIGRPECLDAMGASFVNAIAANLFDYDDTHLATVIHPTAPVAPPVLALAEQRGLTGTAALHAFVLGVEIECRLGKAVSPGHYARGWHITATCGVFGAAAACAKLLGLDAAQIASALGIAASQSAGVVENLASAAKNVGVGNAARNGLLAALLADSGYAAAAAALDGPLGWARAMGDPPSLPAITGGLGERWQLSANTYKPYPSGIVFHAVIDACLALRDRHRLVADDIAVVCVRGNRLLLERGDRPVVVERDARVSIHHSAAVALARGRATLEEFDAAAVSDPEIMHLRAKVQAECDPAMPTGAATVTVETRDRRRESVRVDHARGSLQRPLSDAELESKFRENAARAGFAGRERALIEAIWRFDEAPDLRSLMRQLAAPA
jgi:2-methylcitrate dehydratase PrpD